MSMCKYNYSHVHTGPHTLVCHTQEMRIYNDVTNVSKVRNVSKQHDVIQPSAESEKAVSGLIGTIRIVPSEDLPSTQGIYVCKTCEHINLVLFFSTKTMGIMKIHFRHRVGRYVP